MVAAEILPLEFINNLRYLLGIACCYRVANRQAYGMIGNIVSDSKVDGVEVLHNGYRS